MQHCKKYTPAIQPKTLLTIQIFRHTYFWLMLEKNLDRTIWNCPDNLDFDKGKILAKILIRKHVLSIYNIMTIKQQINNWAIRK